MEVLRGRGGVVCGACELGECHTSEGSAAMHEDREMVAGIGRRGLICREGRTQASGGSGAGGSRAVGFYGENLLPRPVRIVPVPRGNPRVRPRCRVYSGAQRF